MDSNRESWNRDSDDYQRRHGALLTEKPLAWGAWRIAEADLNVLGKVEGLDVLELGCGAAQWTIALLQSGARAVGGGNVGTDPGFPFRKSGVRPHISECS